MDHEDGDGDGASLTLVLMETLEGERRSLPEVIPAAFPPSIFSGGSLLSPVSWFCVSPQPARETPRGTIFIVGFRSRRSQGDKDRQQRSHEAQNKGSHAAKESGHVGLCLWAFGPPLFRLQIGRASCRERVFRAV